MSTFISDTPDTRDAPAAVSSPWWARRQREQSDWTAAPCPKSDCPNATASPFDLYCRVEEAAESTAPAEGGQFHLVVLGSDRRTQVAAVYVTRAAFGVLALIAAAAASRIPLYIGAGLAGTLLLATSLRHFRRSRIVGPAAWIAVLAMVVAVREGWVDGSPSGHPAGILLAALMASCVAAAAVHRSERRPQDIAHRGLVLALSILFAAALLLALFALGVGSVGDTVRNALLLVCLGALSGALGGTALTGFVRGFREANLDGVRRREWKDLAGRTGRRSPAARATPTPHGFVERLGSVVARVVTLLGTRLIEMLIRAVDSLAREALRIEYAIRCAAIWLARLLALATIDALAALYAAAAVAARIVYQWVESTLLGLLLLACAAEAAALACALFASYLGGGTLPEGLASLALTLPATGALVAVWWVLTKWPAREIAQSAQHTLEGAAPTVLLTLVALGWADGIAGLLGAGPIRPGWLTIGGSAILLVVAGYSFVKQRREGDAGEDLPGAGSLLGVADGSGPLQSS
jgi:hypothetical protein